MSDGVPEPPALDPAELAGRTFGRSRKGYEQAEVGAALGLAADALRLWQDRDERLRARIDQLEAALAAVQVLEDGRVASLLGADAVDALLAAREAAEEIRRRAEADAAEAAAHLRAELDAEAELARNETEQLRAEVLKAAEAELASARRRGREMVAEARAVRERMLRDLAERRRTARQQIAAAQAGRDQILEALRAAGVAVDGATLNLGGIDPVVARAAERAALSVEDDIDRFVETLRGRLGDPGPDEQGELAEVTVLEVVEAPAEDEAPPADTPERPEGSGPGDAPADVADDDHSPDGPAPVEAVAAEPGAAEPDDRPAAAANEDDVVVELVVPEEDLDDGPEVVGDLALATPPSELAAARRTVGADAEVIEFATAVRRPASYFVDDELDADDLDDDYDDLDDDYDDFEFDEGTEDGSAPLAVVEGTSDDAAAAAATVHDLITRMRESAEHHDGPSAPAEDPSAPAD